MSEFRRPGAITSESIRIREEEASKDLQSKVSDLLDLNLDPGEQGSVRLGFLTEMGQAFRLEVGRQTSEEGDDSVYMHILGSDELLTFSGVEATIIHTQKDNMNRPADLGDFAVFSGYFTGATESRQVDSSTVRVYSAK